MQSLPTLFSDNLGATYLSANPIFHYRMKHLAINYHFVRDLVQSFELCVVHVSVDDQLTDALTKSLSRPRLLSLCNKFCDISGTILRGRIIVYLGFLLLSLCFYLFAIVLVFLYTSTISIIIKSLS